MAQSTIAFLYVKLSRNRELFINEFWLIIPTALIIDYFLIKRILKNHRESEKLKKKIEREKQLRRIFNFAIGQHPLHRGGADEEYITALEIADNDGKQVLLDVVDKRTCSAPKGLSYLDLRGKRGKEIRKKLFNAMKGKQGRIVYVTVTTLCEVIKQNINLVDHYIPLPIGVGAIQLIAVMPRQLIITTAVGISITAMPPLIVYAYLAHSLRTKIIYSLLTLGAGAAAWVFYRFTNLDLNIPTIPFRERDIDDPYASEQVVIVNNDKLTNRGLELDALPADQNSVNSLTIVDNSKPLKDLDLGLSKMDEFANNLDYDDLYNLEKLTNLKADENILLGDIEDIIGEKVQLPVQKPITRAKYVDFKDKFPDNPPLCDLEDPVDSGLGWDELLDLIGNE